MPTVEKTIKVEGMMCGHCEAHVKEALEKIKGIEEATADHETGKVVLKLSKEVDDKKIADAVKKAGANILVSGTAILAAKDYKVIMDELKK